MAAPSVGIRLADLLIGVLVYNELLAPNTQHWVYDTPLFGLCLEATGTYIPVSSLRAAHDQCDVFSYRVSFHSYLTKYYRVKIYKEIKETVKTTLQKTK